MNLDEAEELTRSPAASMPDADADADADAGDGQMVSLTDALKIERVDDAMASCTRVTTSVGGSLEVNLRGPSA